MIDGPPREIDPKSNVACLMFNPRLSIESKVRGFLKLEAYKPPAQDNDMSERGFFLYVYPVLPKPPEPRTLVSSSSTSTTSGVYICPINQQRTTTGVPG
jgi:hypothetical protein